MAHKIVGTKAFSRASIAVLLAMSVGVIGCGGADEQPSDLAPGDDPANGDELVDDDLLDGEGSSEDDFPLPVAVLPFETDVPDGYRMLPASCEVSDQGASDEDPDADYATWITYAVPEVWDVNGRGGTSSGNMIGANEDRRFAPDPDNSSRGSVKIEVRWDDREPNGDLLDGEGAPWTTFDHYSRIGDDEVTITYDHVGMVRIGDQDAEVFHMDPSQAPDHVSDVVYKVRLTAAELPTAHSVENGHELRPFSFVAAISFDPEHSSIDQETVEGILSTFVVPECAWDATLLDYEVALGLDLNQDGEVRGAEDVQKELEDQLDEHLERLQEEMDKELVD